MMMQKARVFYFDEEFDDNNYPGPHFEDLDKGVQDAFYRI